MKRRSSVWLALVASFLVACAQQEGRQHQDPEPTSERVYHTNSLMRLPTPPRLGSPPAQGFRAADRREYERVADRTMTAVARAVRAFVKPELRSTEALEILSGMSFSAQLQPEQHEWVGRFIDLQASLYLRPAFEIVVDHMFLETKEIEAQQLAATPRLLSAAETRAMLDQKVVTAVCLGVTEQSRFLAVNLIPFSSTSVRKIEYVKDYDVTVACSWVAADPVIDSVHHRIEIEGQVSVLPDDKIGIDVRIKLTGVVLPIETVFRALSPWPRIGISKPVHVSCSVDVLGLVSEGRAIALVGTGTANRKPVFLVRARVL